MQVVSIEVWYHSMISLMIQSPEFSKTIELPGDKEVFLERKKGTGFCIKTEYDGVYGMGEKFDTLNQKGRSVENQVIEKFCNQGTYTYCAMPFFVTDTGLGIYIETKEKTIFSFQNMITCELPKEAVIYVFTGSIKEVVCDYMKLSGAAKLPPEYAFGVWISANRWNSQKDVERQLSCLEKYDFPASVLVLEAWSDEATFYIWNGADYEARKQKEGFHYEDFDFSHSTYWNNPREMIERLHDKGLKLVLWQIPVFKKQEDKEEVSIQLQLDKEYAIDHRLCVMNENQTPYAIPNGNWFEGSYIPDFTNAKTREFWFAKRQYLLDIGVDGFKTDGGEFIYKEDVTFSDGTTGKQGKNQYCQEYINAYADFISEKNVLFSRAGYTGTHTATILWAGDHESTNEELKNVLVAGLSAAMSGIPFWSFDIGGFAGKLPSMDLYLRSTQFACFCPIMQWHSEPDGGQFRELMAGIEGNNERSPWNMAQVYGKSDVLEEIRYWHKLRMKLIPYLFSVAKESSLQYKPMMRSLIYMFQNDRKTIRMEDEYMLGDSILVAPLLEENQRSREVYLPEGEWYGFFSETKYQGNTTIRSGESEKFPVYIRSGYSMPLQEKDHIKIQLCGEIGSDQLYTKESILEYQWHHDKISVKGVVAENIEWCFMQ